MFEVGCEKRAIATGEPVGYDPCCFLLKGWVKILPFANKRRGEKNYHQQFLVFWYLYIEARPSI